MIFLHLWNDRNRYKADINFISQEHICNPGRKFGDQGYFINDR